MSLGPTIQDAQHLHVVPDGTIISWYRIPGDATSEAVAFVRREVEYDEPTPHGGPAVTVWVSPGGWDPHTIEDAGVNFPATVIRWGDVSVEALVGAEVPMLTETLCHGGTWSREKALECAVTLYAGALQGGSGIQLAEVMKDARRFEVWLDRDPEVNEDPLFDRPMPGEPPFMAPPPEELLSTRLLRAHEAIEEARQKFGPTIAGGLAVDGVRIAAMSLAERGE